MKSTASRQQTQINSKKKIINELTALFVCDSKRLLREHLLINDQKYAVSFRSCSVSLTYSQLYYEMYQMEHCLMLLFASFTHFIHKFIKEGEKNAMSCVCARFLRLFFHIHTTSVGALEEKKKSYYVARLHDLKIYE